MSWAEVGLRVMGWGQKAPRKRVRGIKRTAVLGKGAKVGLGPSPAALWLPPAPSSWAVLTTCSFIYHQCTRLWGTEWSARAGVYGGIPDLQGPYTSPGMPWAPAWPSYRRSGGSLQG